MATRSMNKVFVLGNLTRDPELRYTAKGTPVCTFGVATNREWSPADSDEVREDTEYHNIVSWSKLAELCAQLLYKGRKVFIEGRLNTMSWDDAETGKRMYRTEVVCTEMIALGAPRGRTGSRDDIKMGPEAEKPEAEKPEAEKPEAEKPEAEKPEVEKPEVEETSSELKEDISEKKQESETQSEVAGSEDSTTEATTGEDMPF